MGIVTRAARLLLALALAWAPTLAEAKIYFDPAYSGILYPGIRQGLPSLNYPRGVLAAQVNWDAKSVYGLQLPGATGMRIPASALKVPAAGNLPANWELYGTGRLIPHAGAQPLIGYDLSKFYVYEAYGEHISGVEITDCLFGDGFDQSGAGKDTPWIAGDLNWQVHHNTMKISGADKNMNHWLVFGPGSSIYRNNLQGFPDDPISAGGNSTKVQSLVYENYVADPIVPAGNHADFFNVDGGNVKIYRNLARVSDLVKYAGFNNALHSEPTNSTVYGVEFYNNVVQGWAQTNDLIQSAQTGAGIQGLNFHDNVLDKAKNGYYRIDGSGGFTNSSGNLDIVTGLAITEYPIAGQPVNTTKGTPSSSVVGTTITINGEAWNVGSGGTIYYQWVSVDGNGVYTLLANGGNATYTPVSADVGKVIGRITQYKTNSGSAQITAALSNTVTVTSN